MNKDKVIFLAHRSQKVDVEYTEYLTCKNCRNKTYKITYSQDSEFPMLSCVICGNLAGHFGWVDPENLEGDS